MEQYGKLVKDRSRESADRGGALEGSGLKSGRQTGNSLRYTMEFRGKARGQGPPDIFEVRGQK